MVKKIELLYDYEIADMVHEEALRLIPMFRYVVTEFPAASWEDMSYTIAQYIKSKGFDGFPTEIIPVPQPVVETVVEEVPDELAEDINPSDELIVNDDVETRKPLILPTEPVAKVKATIDVRKILGDLGDIR